MIHLPIFYDDSGVQGIKVIITLCVLDEYLDLPPRIHKCALLF